MLGEHLLVAPVVEQGATRRAVYLPQLPQGKRWFDFYTRQAYEAGTTQVVDAALEHLPLFVAEGGRIPVAAPRAGQVPRHDDAVAEVLVF
jgi:alpha-glucosidase (family GH31 glycosyl hydrolase)